MARNKSKKRVKKKFSWVLILSSIILLLAIAGVEVQLYLISHELPFLYTIFFLGLVNFNIILFLFIAYMIFSNFRGAYQLWQSRTFRTWRGQLMMSYLFVAIVPVTMIFLVSMFYINNSFDKWFGRRVSDLLKTSMELANSYYVSSKNQNYMFGNRVKDRISGLTDPAQIKKEIRKSRKEYGLDQVEFYAKKGPVHLVSMDESFATYNPPKLTGPFLEKGLAFGLERSEVVKVSGGNIIRVFIPMTYKGGEASLSVSSFIPLHLVSQMDAIASTYEEHFRYSDPLTYTLRPIYLIVLLFIAIVILSASVGAGIFMSRQVTGPLEEVVAATKKLAQGNYQKVRPKGLYSFELKQLVDSFNFMSTELARSEKERQKTLEQLDEHSRYIEEVFKSSDTGLVALSEKDELVMINQRAFDLLFSSSGKEKVSGPAKSWMPKKVYEVFLKALKNIKKRNLQSDGKKIELETPRGPKPLQILVSKISTSHETQIIGSVIAINDLTTVLQAQRAQLWEEVAQRIAHEIKNPLTPIRLAAQRLQKKFGAQIKDKTFKECTRMVVDQVELLKHLVNEFSLYARLPELTLQRSNFNDCVKESLSVFEQGHQDIKWEKKFDSKAGEFLFDPLQIKRAVTNILGNATAALKDQKGGKVLVVTQAKGGTLVLTIQDNGPGLPQSLQNRIFEPYITTKKHGSGLGLSIVKKIIEEHKGKIFAVSSPGQGLTMKIELPMVT